jgi:hypothetical protein
MIANGRLVVGFQYRRQPGLDSKLGQVIFLVDKVALWLVFSST